MPLGLGMGLRMRGRAAGLNLPAVSGQTLIAREWFDANRTSGSLGIFSSVTGQISGGLSRGPRAVDHTTRRSGSFRQYTAAELANDSDTIVDAAGTGTIMARCKYAPGVQGIKVGGWFYLVSGNSMSLPRELITHVPVAFGGFQGHNLRIKYVDSTGVMTAYLYYGSSAIGSATITPNSYYWLELSVVNDGVNNVGQAAYMALGDNDCTVIASDNGAGLTLDDADEFWLCQEMRQNEGAFVGRVAAYSVYETTHAARSTYPTDIDRPSASVKTHRLDATNGNDANVNGPWQTPAGLATALRNVVFLGVPLPWKTGSATVNDSFAAGDTFTFASINASLGDVTAAGKYAYLARELGDTYRNDSDALVPQGDTLSIASGEYYFTSDDDGEFSRIRGIDIVGDSSDKPVFYLDRTYNNFTWDDAGSGAWETTDTVQDGPARLGVWQSDGSDGWLPLYPIRVADQTIALAAVQAIQGSYWTEDAGDPGTVFVHPYGNLDANDVDFRFAADFLIATDTFNGFRINDGRVKDIEFRGGVHYKLDSESNSLVSHYPVGAGDYAVGFFAIFDGILSKEYGKHGMACGAQNVVRAVVVCKDCETQSGPVDLIASGGTITAATAANPSSITLNQAHGMQTGYPVTISGSKGNTSINGTWNVTVTSSVSFTIPVLGNGAYSGDGVAVVPVGWGAGAWTAFVLHTGAPDRSVDGDGVIACVYDCVDTQNVAVVGSTTPTTDTTRASFFIHNSGGDSQFALVVMAGNTFGDTELSYVVAAGNVIQQYVINGVVGP